MRVTVLGLGYVGLVNATCLAAEGNRVIGVEVNADKVQLVNAGQSPLKEPGLDDMLVQEVKAGRLRATTDAVDAITKSDVTFVCVGTPSRADGSIDLSQVEGAFAEVGDALAMFLQPHTVVLRSTVPPGSTRRLARSLASKSGRKLGLNLFVVSHPEFVRAGSSVRDFYEPAFSIAGAEHDAGVQILRQLYAFLSAPFITVGLEEAELLKYANNAFHATKIAFANEIGRIARVRGVDGERVMEILGRDQVLNASAAYLRPGMPFGGSCLPKDLSALVAIGKSAGIHLPVLAGVTESNVRQVDDAYDFVVDALERSPGPVGVVGLTFKAGTDDIRQSPTVAIVQRLLIEGHQVQLFDEQLELGRMPKPNRVALETQIPAISDILVDEVTDLALECSVVLVDRRFSSSVDTTALKKGGAMVVALDELLSGYATLPDMPAITQIRVGEHA